MPLKKQFLWPLIIFALLAGLYYVKETRGITPLEQGFSNEALLVWPEKYPEHFKNDDYHAYTPVPYIPLHKAFVGTLIWSSVDGYQAAYRLWLGVLVFVTSISLFAWFFYLSKSVVLSTALAVASVVGYFENWWMFVLWGLKDINISARNNFTPLIPMLLIMFFHWIKDDRRILLFFFVFGLTVNVHPGVAMTSFLPFIIAFLVFRKFRRKALIAACVGTILFLVGALPCLLQSNHLMNEYARSHQRSPQYHELVNQIDKAITGEVADKYRDLQWGQGKVNPQGNWFFLLLLFVAYPPMMALILLIVTSLFAERHIEELKDAPKQPKLLMLLIVSSIGVILLGWFRYHFEMNSGYLERIPPFQYVGNFLICLAYGAIAIFLCQLRHIVIAFDKQLKKALMYLTVALGSVLVAEILTSILAPDKGLTFDLFIGNNLPWIFALVGTALLLVWRGKSKLLSNYCICVIILAVACGFSFHYDEFSLHSRYLSKNANYGFYVVPLLAAYAILGFWIFRLFGRGSKRPFASVAFLSVLFLIPLSWRFPVRLYNNASLIFGGQPEYFSQRFTKEPALHEMAKWVDVHTPVDSRFLISSDVSEFKTLARRSMPFLAGGDYAYFGIGDKVRVYMARNSDRYKDALRTTDETRLLELSRELRADYAVVSKKENPAAHFDKLPIVFENSAYRLYRTGTAS